LNKCKTCGNEIKNNKIYCSINCKFSDEEYNKKRGIKKLHNDPLLELKCTLCNYNSKDINNLSGTLTRHLRDKHLIDKFDEKYFEKVQYIEEIKETIKCPYCDWKTVDIENKSGMFGVHIRKKHNISIDEFIEKNNSKEFKNFWFHKRRVEKLNKFVNESEKNGITCKICNIRLKKLSNTHLQKHNITPTEYRHKYNILTTNSQYSKELQSDITSANNIKYGIFPKRQKSSIEEDLENKLKLYNIKYMHQYLINGKHFDFYIPEINTIIETDGEAFHKDKLENLTFGTINNSINDFEKNNIIKNLNFNFYRIRYNKDNFNFNNLTELKELLIKYSYTQDFNVKYDSIIVPKEYFIRYKEKAGVEKLSSYIRILIKFVRTFNPEFIKKQCNENINDIIEKIKNYNFNNILNDNIFNNIKCSSIGISYLKNHFDSFWKSKRYGNISPMEAWFDDSILYKILKYRIGINNSGEVFNFTLNEIIKGLSAYRYQISFFNPILAASIYKYFLKNIKNPVVIDPCAGFGARMMGFKSIYPNGTYIGIEPNPETFNELISLSKNFNNVKLYNCKLEEYDNNKECDLTFTSIPYFNNEIYSDGKNMKKDQWLSMINHLINNYNSIVINLSENSYENIKFNYNEKYLIKYSASHFNIKNKFKYDLLLKLF